MIQLADHSAQPYDESFYRRHFSALVDLATSQHDIPLEHAEDMAHEVLLSLLRQPNRPSDIESWLIAAMSAAVMKHQEPHQ